ncbi:hypothetical protein [Bifidobacterium bombi]|nr:hypothetical protein [Bifidobacterium bombi]
MKNRYGCGIPVQAYVGALEFASKPLALGRQKDRCLVLASS